MNQIYNVAIQNKCVEVVGTYGITERPFGRRFGNYGCGDEPQVSVRCVITDEDGYIIMDGLGMKIDNMLPAKLFLGKKEGDIVDAGNFRLKCIQKNNPKYICDMLFEDAFLQCIQNRPWKKEDSSNGREYSVCQADYFTPEISPDVQDKMIREFIKLATGK